MTRKLIATVALLSITFSSLPIASSYPRAIYHARHIKAVQIPWPSMKVVTTGYVVKHDHGCYTYTDHTASGTVAKRGTIATDTRTFPTRTKFYIPGYGYGIARDTGGAVIGRHIDLAFYTCKEAITWGSRVVLVSYLLPKGQS